ncbi:hypothetical protein EAO69_24975 [Streptomyces sp. me109]|nr:hypothetical protein EAO69_24975 [Streptomyces sp. me109]
MVRSTRTAVAATTALLCAATAATLTGSHHLSATAAKAQRDRSWSTEPVTAAMVVERGGHPFTGIEKIKVGDRSVRVSCSGESAPRRPVVVLMAGLGDGPDSLSGIQQILGASGETASHAR